MSCRTGKLDGQKASQSGVFEPACYWEKDAESRIKCEPQNAPCANTAVPKDVNYTWKKKVMSVLRTFLNVSPCSLGAAAQLAAPWQSLPTAPTGWANDSSGLNWASEWHLEGVEEFGVNSTSTPHSKALSQKPPSFHLLRIY